MERGALGAPCGSAESALPSKRGHTLLLAKRMTARDSIVCEEERTQGRPEVCETQEVCSRLGEVEGSCQVRLYLRVGSRVLAF